MSASGILQPATVISLTDQVAIGAELAVENALMLQLFLSYVKGDETGVSVRMFTRRLSGSVITYQSRVWSESAGIITPALESIYLIADGDYRFEWLLGAIDYVYFTQAGTNDGTPTGTLAAAYALL